MQSSWRRKQSASYERLPPLTNGQHAESPAYPAKRWSPVSVPAARSSTLAFHSWQSSEHTTHPPTHRADWFAAVAVPGSVTQAKPARIEYITTVRDWDGQGPSSRAWVQTLSVSRISLCRAKI